MEAQIEGTVEIDIDDIWMELEDRVEDKLVEIHKGADGLAASAAREVFEDMDLDGKFESAIKEAVDEALEQINDPLEGGAKERLDFMNKDIANLHVSIRRLHHQILELKGALEFQNSQMSAAFKSIKFYLDDNPEGYWSKPYVRLDGRTWDEADADRETICTQEDKQGTVTEISCQEGGD